MTDERKRIEREALIVKIHAALGGNGWAYANWGSNELQDCREQLERVAEVLASDLERALARAEKAEAEAARLRAELALRGGSSGHWNIFWNNWRHSLQSS